MIYLVLLEQGEYDGNGGVVVGGDGVSFGRSCWGCCNRRDRREGRILCTQTQQLGGGCVSFLVCI